MKESGFLSRPLKTGSVARLVMERIKEGLLNKELKPGDYLPSETELANRLGVGKSSIREAIKMLQIMGVVEVRQGHGTFIREHPDGDIVNSLVFQLILEQGTSKDIFDLRAMFEPAYTIMAMENATDQDLKKIEATLIEFEDKICRGTQTADDDLAFHYAILESTHNPFVIRIGKTVLQLFKASIAKSVSTIPETSIHDHKKIFEAFREKNREKLQKAVLESFKGWMKAFDGDFDG